MTVQTRSEENGLQHFQTVKEAFDHSVADHTVWKISFNVGNERVRFISNGDRTWIYETLSMTAAREGSQSDIPFYNEACATCGIPRDIHLGPKDKSSDLPHSIWGDLNRCREFKRCEPPKAAYGVLGK